MGRIGIDERPTSGNTYTEGISVTENDIAVFSHDLDDQIFPAEVTKFIEMFNCTMYNLMEKR